MNLMCRCVAQRENKKNCVQLTAIFLWWSSFKLIFELLKHFMEKEKFIFINSPFATMFTNNHHPIDSVVSSLLVKFR